MPRFVLLEHTSAPDDPAGLHYDLLLENGPDCRTWRLAAIPEPDGPEVIARELPPHRLAWLDHEAGEVSGGRGFARRIDGGVYASAPVAVTAKNSLDGVRVTLRGGRLAGGLIIRPDDDRWLARFDADRLTPVAGPSPEAASVPPMRDARDDWRRFAAGAIPTKESTPHLDAFIQDVKAEAAGQPLTLLDVGCGSGRLSQRLYELGFSVLGVDINPDAIQAAQRIAATPDAAGRLLRFAVADFAEDELPSLGGPFDVVVCQLVISIIGDPRSRTNLLRHVRDTLAPRGSLFLSASGVSDTINAGYARLYAEDLHLTGERHTYLSRDAGGEVLYTTHHFMADELASLLEAAGFGEISVTTEKETSSRRPDEAAFFLYATCRSPS